MVSANVNSGLQARRLVVGALRMQEEPGSKESTETKAAVDPYEVKKEVPSWAKEENQWELDMKAGEAAEDKKKKAVAVATGAVAMLLSLAYLGAVAVLESRGPLQPPPCEATDTCEEALEAAALPLKHLFMMAMHL